jgi:hypothetical protein
MLLNLTNDIDEKLQETRIEMVSEFYEQFVKLPIP